VYLLNINPDAYPKVLGELQQALDETETDRNQLEELVWRVQSLLATGAPTQHVLDIIKTEMRDR
jgi:hypothetical protein